MLSETDWGWHAVGLGWRKEGNGLKVCSLFVCVIAMLCTHVSTSFAAGQPMAARLSLVKQ